MRNPGGYAVWFGGEGPVRESDTLTCVHCNTVFFVVPRQDLADLGGFCRQCMWHTCRACADKPCAPFEKKLEAIERRDRLRAAAGA